MLPTYNLHNLCNYTSLESESLSPESVVQYSCLILTAVISHPPYLCVSFYPNSLFTLNHNIDTPNQILM